MTESFKNDLIENLNIIGLSISEIQMEQLYKFYIMLVEKNKVMNLTAITEEHDVIVKHFIDSMSIYNKEVNGFQINESSMSDKSIIDVGTGAGFPGLVLKILFPDLKVVLSDSLNKRLNFIQEVIDELGLKDIELVHGRAEDLAHNPKFREKFDFATSRAVANLSTLTEYDLPFVKVGGYFMAYKSGKIEEELANASRAISIIGGEVRNKVNFLLSDGESERSIVFIYKIKKTPKNYPRKAGTPSKSPL